MPKGCPAVALRLRRPRSRSSIGGPSDEDQEYNGVGVIDENGTGQRGDQEGARQRAPGHGARRFTRRSRDSTWLARTSVGFAFRNMTRGGGGRRRTLAQSGSATALRDERQPDSVAVAPAEWETSTVVHSRFRQALRGGACIAVVALFAANPATALTLLTEENPPFNYAKNGQLTGLVARLVLETARRTEMPVQVEMLPWHRAYSRAQSENDTCIFSTARAENRERLFTWIGPFASNLWGVYGRTDFAGELRVLADLKRFRLGGVAGDAKVEYLKQNGVTNIREALEDRVNPSRLFLPPDHRDHIDMWVSGFFGAHVVARAAKAGEVKLLFIIREIPLYLACSPRTSPATVKALTAALESIRAEGMPERLAAEYEEIFAK